MSNVYPDNEFFIPLDESLIDKETRDLIKNWKLKNESNRIKKFSSSTVTDQEYQDLDTWIKTMRNDEVQYGDYKKAFNAFCRYIHTVPTGTIFRKIELKKGKESDHNSLYVEFADNTKTIKLPAGTKLYHMSKEPGIIKLKPFFRGKAAKGYLYDKPRIYFTIYKNMPKFLADYKLFEKMHVYVCKKDITDVYVDPLVPSNVQGAVYIETNSGVDVEEITGKKGNSEDMSEDNKKTEDKSSTNESFDFDSLFEFVSEVGLMPSEDQPIEEADFDLLDEFESEGLSEVYEDYNFDTHEVITEKGKLKDLGKKAVSKVWDKAASSKVNDKLYKRELEKRNQTRTTNTQYQKDTKDIINKVAKEELCKWSDNSSNTDKCLKSINKVIDNIKKKYDDPEDCIDSQNWDYVLDLADDKDEALDYDLDYGFDNRNQFIITPASPLVYLHSEYSKDLNFDILPTINKDICTSINNRDEIKELIKEKKIKAGKVNGNHIEFYVEGFIDDSTDDQTLNEKGLIKKQIQKFKDKNQAIINARIAKDEAEREEERNYNKKSKDIVIVAFNEELEKWKSSNKTKFENAMNKMISELRKYNPDDAVEDYISEIEGRIDDIDEALECDTIIGANFVQFLMCSNLSIVSSLDYTIVPIFTKDMLRSLNNRKDIKDLVASNDIKFGVSEGKNGDNICFKIL